MALFKTISEIKNYIAVDGNSAFSTILPYVQEAEDTFLKGIISEPLYDVLEPYYQDPSPADADLDALLPYVQRCLAHYTYYLAIVDLGMNIGDTGLMVRNDDYSDPAPQWKVNKFEQARLAAGDRAAERLLAFLEENAVSGGTYDEWVQSDEYSELKDSFVQNATELAKWANLSNPRRMYVKLKHYIRTVEDTEVRRIVCDTTYTSLKSELAARNLSDVNAALVEKIQPYVVKKALVMAIPELQVSINADGIHLVTSSDGIGSKSNVSDNQLKNLWKGYEEQAQLYYDELKGFLIKNVDDYPDFKASECYTEKADPGPLHRPENLSTNKHFSV